MILFYNIGILLWLNFIDLVILEESKCQEIEKFNHRCSLLCNDITEFNSDYIEKSNDCSWDLTIKGVKNKKIALTEDYFQGEFSNLNIDKITFISSCITKIDDDFLKPIFSEKSDKYNQLWSLSITKSDCLTEIEDDIFKPLHHLKYLDLSFNKIVKIDDEAFIGLQMLDILNLNNNQLKRISKIIFAPLISLKSLDLSGNNILIINPFAFKKLVRLEILKLKRNQIKNLSKGVFDKFKFLHTLDLSHNKLEIFSPNFLSEYCRESIKNLYLNNNRLQTLSYKVLDFKNLNPSHLDILLSDNLWICDRKLAWIKKIPEFVLEKSVKCFLPSKFKELTMDKISMDWLQNTDVKIALPDPKPISAISIRDEIIGVVVSVFCVVFLLILLFIGYRNRWCTKSDYWENNKAQFVKTEVEADEESEICMIYMEEAEKSVNTLA